MTKMHGAKGPGATPKKVHKGHSWDYVAGTNGNDVFEGGRGTQIVDAGAGNDSISGGSGRDLLFGGSGNDRLVGGKRGDLVFGGSGNDLLDVEGNGHHHGNGADALFGDGYESFGDLLSGKKVTAPGNDTIRGGRGNDLIFGDNGSGGSAGGDDLIEGGRGNDLMFGEGGNDTLVGGRGGDIMDGGAGADVFVYGHADESRGRDVDLIRNFVQGQDRIDLTGVLGDAPLNWCDTKPTAYGVWYVQKGGCTLVCVDLDGNPKTVDMVIRVEGKIQLCVDDFRTAGGQQPPNPNTPPVATNDTAVTNEDTAVTVNVLANDKDANGDALTVTGASALHGAVTINAGGTLTYTPVGNYNGGDTITYTISDGKGGTATGSVAVTVAAVNDGPVAVADKATASEDTAVTVNVLGNDSDLDGDKLSVTAATAGHGTVTVNSDGTLTYKGDANFNGGDTITYSISDGKGGSATSTVAITVNAVNDGPVAGADKASTNEDTAVTVNVLANDSDVDGDKLSVTAATAGHGTVTVNSDGTLTYKGDANFNGGDTITYSISDGKGGSATSTVAVTVNAVNDGPAAGADKASTSEDTAVTVNVLGNDSDVDGDKMSVTGASAGHGSVVVNADGTLTYTPDTNYNGSDTVTYSISDGKGGSATSTVAVTVNAVNDAPAANDDSALTNEDTSVTVNVLGNDGDVDGDKMSVTGASAAHGSVVVNADGTLTYTPNANYSGGDTITYSVSDGKGGSDSATVDVTVTPDNDGPVAQNDSVTTSEDTEVTVDVLDNDSDPEGNGLTVTGASALHGAVVVNADSTLTYTPDANYHGGDTITYTVSDGEGGTASATVAVTVNSVNDVPVAGDDSASTDEDSSVTVNVLGNDSDADGDSLTVTGASALHGTVTVNADGTLTYTPDANYHGGDTITYSVTDGQEATSNAQVDVTVASVNDNPVAGDDAATIDEDTSVTITVLGNDGDVDGDLITVTGATAGHGTVTINADGSLTYKGDADFNGTDSISYEIDDGHGGSATATVAVTVNAVNDAPVAKNDAAAVDEDSSVTIDVLGNDGDVDGDTLSVTGASAAHGTVTVNGDGTLTYKGDADFNGTDTITYSIGDGKGGTSSATVAVTVNAVNDAPVAGGDAAVTDEDTAVTVNVLGNDGDVDGDALSVTKASAAHGTVAINGDGTLTYTPAANYNGTDTITYSISDGKGGTSSASVAVTINAVNDAPVAKNDAATLNEDSLVRIAVLANDSDVDGDKLTVTGASADHGTVIVNATGTIDYMPGKNYNGSDTITYTISDGKGGSTTATVSVTVNSVNDLPTAGGDTATTDEDTAVTVNVLANDGDVDGDALSVTGATALHGSVAINGDGSLTYTPGANYNGPDTITYTVSDGHGGAATGSVAVTVNSVNDVPVAKNDAISVDEDNGITFGVLGNDSDADNDALTVTGATAGHGTVTVNGDGSLSYKGDANYNGDDTITYSISDGKGGNSTATVAVTVNSVNDLPTAGNDAAVTDEDTPVTINVLANDGDVDGDVLSVTGASALHGTVTINGDGSLTYAPSANYHGPDTVTYTINDGHGGSATAAVAVTVNSVNDLPVAGNDAVGIDEDNGITFGVLGNDSDVEGDTLTVTGATAGHGQIVVNSDNTLTYMPDANFNGTDTVTYTISDGNGGTATATVTITVNPVNDPPIAIADFVVTNEDTPLNIDVLANDSDVDGDALSVTEATAGHGTVTINGDGTLHYAPVANFHGADVITYTVSDGQGGTDTATVMVTVNSVNDQPVANGDTAVLNEDGLVRISVLANDMDVDGDQLAVTGASAVNGTVVVNANNTIDYFPNADFYGTDRITYSVSDGHGGTATATVTVTVNPVNDGPTANGEIWYVSTAANTIIGAERILANDSDRDGGQLQITAINGAAAGTPVTLANGVTLTLLANGSIQMAAPTVASMTTSSDFTYTISDGTATTTATSTISLIQTGSGFDNINLALSNGGTSPFTLSHIDARTNSDQITGSAGQDMLLGDTANDTLTGGGANDTLIGGGGNDNLTGDAGNDVIRGGSSADTLNGGAGSEDMMDLSDGTGAVAFTLVQTATGASAVLTSGGLGTDTYLNFEGVIGTGSSDTLNGSSGADFIRGGAGDDVINGLGGQDVIDFSDATGALDFTLVQSGSATAYSAAGLGKDSYSNIEGVIGGSFNDTLSGSSAGDILRGGLGSDQISGGLGADKLRGGMGADLLTGGAGADRFEYVNGDLAGSPTDTISDFQAGAGGDVLDIAELLVGYSGSDLQNFVQVIDTGDGNTLVRVDIDGSATTYGFQNAVVLTGVSGLTLTDMITNGNLDVTV